MDYLSYSFLSLLIIRWNIYLSHLAGTKVSGPIAAAWASMKHLGENGYISIAKKLMEVLKNYVRASPPYGIIIVGKPL
jgi:glutamate/tyrosine decarboxylase-like PLP-dependent enzyme